MTTTTDPFDPDYLDELALRRDLTALFVRVLDGTDAVEPSPWRPALTEVLGHDVGVRPDTLSPAEQNHVVDAWAQLLLADPSIADVDASDPAVLVASIVRRALQVRVRNDGLTPPLWIDRTFAGHRAPWARAIVRWFGTPAGRGSCRCLDEPIVAGWQCCGSPWLDNGDLERFIRRARRNVALLAEVVREGQPVPIADPVCRAIVTGEYPAYVGGPAADLVAEAYLAAGPGR